MIVNFPGSPPPPPDDPRDLFGVLAELEERLSSADQLAVALRKLLEDVPHGVDRRHWNALWRVADHLASETLNAVAEYRCLYDCLRRGGPC